MERTKNNTFDRADKCIAKLKGIASIQAGDKWSTSHAAPQKSGIITTLTRTFWTFGEDRRLNLADIVDTIDNAFTILEDIYTFLVHSENMDITHTRKYQKTIKDLKNTILDARDGMNRLKIVYHDDATLCHTINKKFDDIKEFYRYLEEKYIIYDGGDAVQYRTPPRTINFTGSSSDLDNVGTPDLSLEIPEKSGDLSESYSM